MDHDLILFSIGRIAEQANRFLMAELRRRGMGELGVSHMEIVGVLTRRDKIQMKELVELIGKDKSTITALVKKLLRLKLITRSPDPGDSRVSHISLTEKGRKLESTVNEISKRLREKAYRGLSERDKEEMMRLLEMIRRNF
ncbi:MAG TPA: MarR family transcriptional regulator [Spirochaetes bacterium]|nr:MarR family transcriptional regulator [Spirochaetota bacterium]